MAPDHPLAGRAAIKLAELRDMPLILFEQGFALNARIEAACRARGFAPHPAARSSQVDFIIALVAAGLGVALLPRILTEGRFDATPGDACRFCAFASSCPAKSAQVIA